MNSSEDMDALRSVGASVKVSSISCFGDDIWQLDVANPSLPPSKKRILWAVSFGEHGCLTDAAHAELLAACKLIIYAMLMGEAVRGVMKAASAVANWQRLRMLVQWMIGNGIQRFSELDDEGVTAFARATRLDARGNGGREPSEAAVRMRLLPLKHVLEFGEYAADKPAFTRLPPDLNWSKQKESEQGIPAIPDHIAVPLYAAALRFLDFAPDLLDIKRSVQGVHDGVTARGLSVSRFNVMVRRFFATKATVLELPGERLTLSSLTEREFARVLSDLETACYIAIVGLTGMRVSEMCGLDVGCGYTASIAGEEVFFVKGTLIKTAPVEAQKTSWVAGPAGEDNPVKRAIDILTELYARERVEAKCESLFILGRRSKAKRLTLGGLRFRLEMFARRVPETAGWTLSSHQFRKTFARFVARNSDMALLALKRHFKHVDVQMTARYVGLDATLFEEVLIARDEYSEELLVAVLGSDRLGGALGEIIAQNNSEFRGIAGRDALSAYVRRLRENTDLIMLPHRYGLCIYRADAARCGGVMSRVGVNTCIGCSNFIVAPRHLEYWRERRDQLTAFGDSILADVKTPERESAINTQLEMSNRVISLIEGM